MPERQAPVAQWTWREEFVEVSSKRKLKIAAITAGSVLVTMGLGAIPTASADQCTVTVTLATGQTLTFDVNVPPGTPASALVPPGTGPVKNVSESSAAASTGTTSTPTGTTSTSTRTTTATPTPTRTNPAGKPKPKPKRAKHS